MPDVSRMAPDELSHRFETGQISRGAFGHHDFLLVVAWLLLTEDEARATERIIAGLRRTERSGGGVEWPRCPSNTGPARRGYNETITLFWIGMARRTLPARIARSEQAAAARWFAARYARQPDLVFEYYSPQRVHSLEARMRWVEPDLRPLDSAVSPGPDTFGTA